MNESFDVRRKVIIVNTTRVIAILACIASIVLYFYIDTEGLGHTARKNIIFLMLIPACLLFWVYKSLFKYIVIKPLAHSFDHQLKYEGSGSMDIDKIRNLGIFGLYEGETSFWKRFKGSDYSFKATSEDKFTGEVSNSPFSFEEIKIKKVTGSGRDESEETVLTSYMIELDICSHLECIILAYKDNAENVIATDSIELRRVPNTFSGLNDWHFLSDKPGECADYLRQSKLEYVLKQSSDLVLESLEEESLILYIADGKIRLFIPSEKDRFESPVLGWISSDKVEKFYIELKGMVKMIDILVTWEKDGPCKAAN